MPASEVTNDEYQEFIDAGGLPTVSR